MLTVIFQGRKMNQWLLDRLFKAKDQAEPRFAFQGTINWMRGLAEVVNSGSCSDRELKAIYSKVKRRPVNIGADTMVFENIHMAYHNYASIFSMNETIEDKYDICRSAIISWYYNTYFAASAMVAASSGSVQETHAATARLWQSDIVEKELIPYPFDLYVSSLEPKKVDAEIKEYRGRNIYDQNNYPTDQEQAHGAMVSYLKGTARYRKWEVEERVKSSKEFKDLNVENFRTKIARELRDKNFERWTVNFLAQAFRYRGKANYRDSIFLSYGDDNETTINQFIEDLLDVSFNFLRTASFYCSKRVEKGTWNLFIDDIENNTRLSIDTEAIKI
jgi:hypothetical protein